jgi:hypothetical protein
VQWEVHLPDHQISRSPDGVPSPVIPMFKGLSGSVPSRAIREFTHPINRSPDRPMGTRVIPSHQCFCFCSWPIANCELLFGLLLNTNYRSRYQLIFSLRGPPMVPLAGAMSPVRSRKRFFIRYQTGSSKMELTKILSVSWVHNLFDAIRKIADWHREYNEERPPISLNYRTPAKLAAVMRW